MDKIVILNGYIENNKDEFMDKIDFIETELIRTKIESITDDVAYILSKYMDYSKLINREYALNYLRENFQIESFTYLDDLLDIRYENLNCDIDAVYIESIDSILFTFNNKDKGLINIVNNYFSKFEYWNNIMKPQNVLESEWTIRECAWTEFVHSKKVNIKLFNEKLLNDIDERVILEKIHENYDNRILELAKEIVTANYIKRNPDLLVNNKTGYFKTTEFNIDIVNKENQIRQIILK